MFNLGMGEITVILVLALIFIGPKKLPELASGLGRLIREIRKTTADVKNEIQLDDAIRKPFEELRDAVTLHPEELKRRDRIKRELKELEKQVAEQAARQAAALEVGEVPPALLPDGTSELPPGLSAETSTELSADGHAASIHPEVLASGAPAIPGGLGEAGHAHQHHHLGDDGPADNSAAAIALAAVPTEPSLPNLTGTAPAGTVARGATGGQSALPPPPPAHPHAAPPSPGVVARRGPPFPSSSASSSSASAAAPGAPPSDTVAAGSGVSSELLRALRPGPDSRKTPVVPQSAAIPGVGASAPVFGSADRNNTTQILSDADLATLASTPSPPPPPPPPVASVRPTGKVMSAVASAPSGPALPGATPPKPPTSSST